MLLSDTKVFDMILSKRLRCLWILLTTEEVFDEHGSLGRRSVVRRAPRARKAGRLSGPGSFSGFQPFLPQAFSTDRRFLVAASP
jgi:hypothetical protein